MTIGDGFGSVLAAAAIGRPWACERIYRDLSPTVCGYLRLQGASEPEDLTSEVFMNVFRGLGTFAGAEPQFRSWVFTIAHRRLVDDRRRRDRRPPMRSFDGAVVPDDRCGGEPGGDDPAGGDVEEEALRAISAERVRHLCSTLSPDQRDVLLLRLVSGLTVDEIAEVISRSPGAVKALQRRGLGALRQIVTPPDSHAAAIEPSTRRQPPAR